MVAIAASAVFAASCGQAPAGAGSAAYEATVQEWREARLARLKEPSGFLNQVGLFWLSAGTHTFGSHEGNDVRFPAHLPGSIGVFEVGEDGVRMRVDADVEVLSNGRSVKNLLIADDTQETPVELRLGSIGWSVIKRDNRFAVRVRDFEHPFARDFGPLPYYPIDVSMRVPGTLRRYDTPRTVNVNTVIEGLGYHPESPGIVEFQIDDQPFSLEAYTAGERLFFVFGDATNRDDTYGAGRFLYADSPAADGEMTLDFNLSYSPPCAFNDFSTCPVASPRNRLPIRIEAGEKYHPGLHYSPEGKDPF